MRIPIGLTDDLLDQHIPFFLGQGRFFFFENVVNYFLKLLRGNQSELVLGDPKLTVSRLYVTHWTPPTAQHISLCV
ncbi:hypothetical protein D3C85_1441630 [compost metagenome]